MSCCGTPRTPATTTASENVPRIANTPRQPNRSPITPEIDGAEHIGGERDAEQARDRDLALVASARDRRSSAIATGNTPPATSPATIRMATSSEKLVATAQTSAASAITSTQAFISRVLPKKSPVTPSTGWISA